MQINRKLIKAIKKGDEQSTYELYQYCYDHLFIVCRRYSQNADEVGTMLNSAFMKIVQYIDKYNDTLSFHGWIRKIAVNTAIDYYRKNKRYRDTIAFPDEYGGEQDLASADYNMADQNFDADQLLALIRQLPAMSANVFNLYVIDGYNHKEIGELLNISEGTSKWHLSTARKRLQQLVVSELEKSNKKSKV